MCVELRCVSERFTLCDDESLPLVGGIFNYTSGVFLFRRTVCYHRTFNHISKILEEIIGLTTEQTKDFKQILVIVTRGPTVTVEYVIGTCVQDLYSGSFGVKNKEDPILKKKEVGHGLIKSLLNIKV